MKHKSQQALRRTSQTPNHQAREVTADDVIQRLLNLFDRLGVSSQTVARRARGFSKNQVSVAHSYPQVAAISEVLTAWHQDPAYLNQHGEPAPIKYRARTRSFSSLAKACVPKIKPLDLLRELSRVGAVTTDDDGFIHLNMRSIPVYQNKQLAAQHTLTSLDDFIRTLVHNLTSAPTNSHQLFHRIAWSNSFDPREIPALKIRVKRHGQSFLESCDNWMARRKPPSDKNDRTDQKLANVSVGVYLSVDRD